MNKNMFSRKTLSVILLDAFLIVLSFYLSFVIRFDGNIPGDMGRIYLELLPLVIAVRLCSFYIFKVYRGIWRYASLKHLGDVIKGIVAGTMGVLAVLALTRGFQGVPRSVFIIDTLLLILLIGGSRFAHRMIREGSVKKGSEESNRALIVGAGDAGYAFAREIDNNRAIDLKIIGFVDDDPAKNGMEIQGYPVLGNREAIPGIVRKKNIEEIIIAIPSASRKDMNGIVQICEKTKAVIKTMPPLGDLISGKVSYSQIKNVEIEDLLGREVAEVDEDLLTGYLKGKRVLVTGAGGSIGSEICRQVMKYEPAQLILLGRGENSIYQVHQNLLSRNRTINLVTVLGDVINRKKLDGVFSRYSPEIVFHAAADKHVPMMELNVDEAVLNNVIGTKNVLDAAEHHNVSEVVCISTDKAAEPESVMGCSKKIAELLVQNKPRGATKFIAVRFGNVLGSRGSVIPLFRRQIRSGGPVTVTHKDMVRYFMTIPEAAALVVQAGAMGEDGMLYVLDMGNPVRIKDLAEDMIRLSGLEPGIDIDIEFTGTRPGEKLKEALTGRGEKLSRTSHPKILVIESDSYDYGKLEAACAELREHALAMDTERIRAKLQEILSGQRPQNIG